MPRFGVGPRSTRQQRRLFLERAWQQFRAGVEPHGLREDILSSWRRSRDTYSIDPACGRPLASLDTEALERRRAGEDGLRLAAPILRDFTQRVRLRDHVLSYFDAEGYLLAIDGDRSVLERLAEIGLTPGVSWAEQWAGTNGPGAALAVRKPIEVFAGEHYVAAFQPWSSAAAPIRIPGSPAPAGVVAMTGAWEVRRRQAVTFVSAVARAVEERLRAARAVRDEVVRYAFRASRDAGEALVALDSHGRVIAANEAAARCNVLESGHLPAAMAEAVTGLMRATSTRSDGDVRVDLPEGLPATVCPVSYEGSRVGAIVRLTVSHASRRRSGPPDPAAPARYDFACILGNSSRVRHAVELARMATQNELPVVLSGESGTGKELFAQAVHGASSRAKKPFVAVNCGSIPAEILEAELFGYEPGTFTGARREGKPGRFEDADAGTLFLDEVSELAPPAQTALLRVLQEKEVVRLGASTPRPVDVRVIAATNKPLEQEMRAGRFRSDLYYRLNVLWIVVPPLRERDDDISLLARVFLDEADAERRGLTFSEDAMEALRSYSWPGNVRELRNVVLRAVAVALRPQISARDLFLERGRGYVNAGAELGRAEPRETGLELERGALITALDSCTWNFRRTAHQLGISRMTLYRWIRKYGISRSPE